MKKNNLLDKLRDKIALRTGKKLSQEDIIGKVFEFIYNELNNFVVYHPHITPF